MTNNEFVQSLQRGLAVIRTFDAEHRALRLSEVAERAGLTRAAARRFLLTLVELGYVRRAEDRFSLGPRVLELGYGYLSGLGIADVAQSHMERLVGELNESSSISVLDGTEIVYVVRVPTRRIMTVTLAVGSRLPAYATSMGRVLLAELEPQQLEEHLARIEVRKLTPHTLGGRAALRRELSRVRRQGFALVDQELEEGLRSVALPIRYGSGEVAAVNVSAHASRVGMEELTSRYLHAARAAATRIEADLQSVSTAVGSS